MGATLLEWKLDTLLGIGGMAAVYAATHRNRSRVALKVLHRELAAGHARLGNAEVATIAGALAAILIVAVLRWSQDGTQIEGITAAGRATVRALQLNHVISVMVRRSWVAAGWHPPSRAR